MVKCTNGMIVIEVTEGAYETIFKDQGYRKLDEEHVSTIETESANDGVDTVEAATSETVGIDSGEFASLLEKPISQWSNEEVKSFAEAKGINISGTRNAKEAKARIRKFLDELEQ